MQSPPSLYIPQFQLRELFVCFGRLNRILAEIGHGDFSVHSITDKPLLLLTLVSDMLGGKGIWPPQHSSKLLKLYNFFYMQL